MSYKNERKAQDKRIGGLSKVSLAFVENNVFLKKFVSRFFSNHQDIEDVVQEAYLRAYSAEQKEPVEQPKAFLFRIARNVALTTLTKKSRQIVDYIEECGLSDADFTTSSADEEVEAHEMLGLYCEAIASLPDKCRETFLLRKVHGLSHREIAEQMSLSLSSVEKYLYQGTLSCKAYITKANGLPSARANAEVDIGTL